MSSATQSSAIEKRDNVRKLTKPPNKTDRIRWHLFKQRISVAEIATRHGVGEQAILDSIARMEAAKALSSDEEVNMRMNESVIKLIPDVVATIQEALKAETVEREMNDEGVMEVVARDPDFATRLKAGDLFNRIAARSAPKNAGVQVNVQQNNTGGEGSGSGRSFEQTLRTIRERKGMSNTSGTQDAEFVDADESAEDGDEDDSEE